MFNFIKRMFVFSIVLLPFSVFANTSNIETIVLIRHAEKPVGGLGQLSCQGLNRALQLPNYFKKNFQRPDFIFAPNPGDSVKESDYDDTSYSYVRPLVTIEPTAIALGMPVNAEIGYTDVDKLVSELQKNKYHHATIYVAWEHKNLVKIAKLFLKQFNNKSTVPAWSNKDFDTVFVLKIDWNHQPTTLTFTITSENIKDLRTTCPN